MKLIISNNQYIICFKVFNLFNVYVEYTRYEKVASLFNVEYTRHVVKNLHLLIKVKFR